MLPLEDLSRFLELRTTLDETELVVAFRGWVRGRFGKMKGETLHPA